LFKIIVICSCYEGSNPSAVAT